jgi:hypothetical protein
MTKQIKTWLVRWHEGAEKLLSVKDAMQAEIDELRAALAQTEQPVQGERDAFEAWIKKDGGDLKTFGSGKNTHYSNSAVNQSWGGWKARAAFMQSKPAEPVNQVLLDALIVCRDAFQILRERGVVHATAEIIAEQAIAQAQPAVQFREGCTQYVEAAQPAKREPLTDEQAISAMWAAKSKWMEEAGIDTEGIKHDVPTLYHMLPYFRAAEAAHGITKGQQ